MMKKDKKYDAVQEVRDIREKLSVKYWQHPEELKAALKAVREKFTASQKKKKT
ncbi:hypothetical protein AAHN97_06340 [Chitinophaga niabensis]|uniref:hypothetical protein n=1 Tax=Chitinophaga niabensis TaxID=536979 RepID=UPI0031BBA2F9